VLRNQKIAVAGNKWITEYLITSLVECGYKPSLLIHMSPDKSKNISGYKNLSGFAEKNGIEVYHPQVYTLKSENDRKNLECKEIDLLFVFGWQRLIPAWLINHSSLGVYGVHGGPEKPPRCRGQAVFNWAILLGYTNFYMYLFEIDTGVDSGRILEMTEFDILPHDDIQSVYHKNCVVSCRMILKYLPLLLDKKVKPTKQPDGEPSVLPRRVPENGGIHWDEPAEKVANLIRAVNTPYPGAFTFLESMKVKIEEGHIFDNKITYDAVPGEIVNLFPGGHFVVMAKDLPLYVRRYSCCDPEKIARGKIFQLHSGIKQDDPIV